MYIYIYKEYISIQYIANICIYIRIYINCIYPMHPSPSLGCFWAVDPQKTPLMRLDIVAS